MAIRHRCIEDMSLAERVSEKLKSVIDPETRQSVVEMGVIKDLVVTTKGRVRLKFRPTSFHCPLAFNLAFNIYKTLKEVEGVRKVELEVVDCVYSEEINSFLRSGEI